MLAIIQLKLWVCTHKRTFGNAEWRCLFESAQEILSHLPLSGKEWKTIRLFNSLSTSLVMLGEKKIKTSSKQNVSISRCCFHRELPQCFCENGYYSWSFPFQPKKPSFPLKPLMQILDQLVSKSSGFFLLPPLLFFPFIYLFFKHSCQCASWWLWFYNLVIRWCSRDWIQALDCLSSFYFSL